AGCHGTDGRLGSARPLNDSVYLAVINEDQLRQVIAKGVPGTAMPAFATQAGGSFTDKQIDALIEGMRSRWGQANDLKDVSLPPYSLQDAIKSGSGPGDAQRGANVFMTYCARCHGTDGRGGEGGGSVVDKNFLALTSDQSLRTTTIIGRADFGKPDWRTNVPDHPMTAVEISDVVAWLVAQRGIPTTAGVGGLTSTYRGKGFAIPTTSEGVRRIPASTPAGWNICRNVHTESGTPAGWNICRNGHTESRTPAGWNICRNGHTESRTPAGCNIRF